MHKIDKTAKVIFVKQHTLVSYKKLIALKKELSKSPLQVIMSQLIHLLSLTLFFIYNITLKSIIWKLLQKLKTMNLKTIQLKNNLLHIAFPLVYTGYAKRNNLR